MSAVADEERLEPPGSMAPYDTAGAPTPEQTDPNDDWIPYYFYEAFPPRPDPTCYTCGRTLPWAGTSFEEDCRCRHAQEEARLTCILKVPAPAAASATQGLVVLVDWQAQTAGIALYYESSAGRDGNQLRPHSPVSSDRSTQWNSYLWQGSWGSLFVLADTFTSSAACVAVCGLHPDCPIRDDWAALSSAVRVWRRERCPMWCGRDGSGKGETGEWPKALSVVARAERQAAVRIQSRFRGWWWRLRVLYNPHTVLGARYLRQRWDRS